MTTLDEAIVELNKAVEEYVLCDRLLGEARSRHTSALNRVNKAQKQFDDLVFAVRKAAPRDTDWKRQPGVPVS